MSIHVVKPCFGAPLDDGTGIPILQLVELSSVFQIPSFQVVGLAGQEVGEARERVRSAVEASGFGFPKRRVVLNLSPASIKKRGTGLDLAMALTVLKSTDEARETMEGDERKWIAWGELGLGGEVRGVGQLFRLAYCALSGEIAGVIVAEVEAADLRDKIQELACVQHRSADSLPQVLGVANLGQAWHAVQSGQPGPTPAIKLLPPGRIANLTQDPSAAQSRDLLPLSPFLARVIGVAASGGHHLFLLGPKGTGKSHALQWLERAIPPSAPDLRVKRALLEELREGHASYRDTRWVGTLAKAQALIGSFRSGRYTPGDFVLAHGGLLIADEWPEWHRDAREALREPLEAGLVTLNRVGGAIRVPARFQLAASGNLCPCGGWPPDVPKPDGRAVPRCRCGLAQKQRYAERMSGPVLDRIDLFAAVIDLPSDSTERSDLSPAALSDRVANTAGLLRNRLNGYLPGEWPATEIESWLKRNRIEPRSFAPR
ncbi:MAG: ATP-binding protein, partial [Bdellovibrionota bacterium]